MKALPWIIIAGLVIALFFSWQCNKSKQDKIEAQYISINAFKDSTVREYQDDEGKWMAQVDAVIIERNQLQNINDDLLKELKKKVGGNLKNLISNQGVVIEFAEVTKVVPGIHDEKNRTTNYLLNDSCISISIDVDSLYNAVFNYQQSPLTLEVTTFKDSKLFRKSKIVSTAQILSLCGQVTKMKTIQVVDSRKWYQSGWLKVGVGLVGGVWIRSKVK